MAVTARSFAGRVRRSERGSPNEIDRASRMTIGTFGAGYVGIVTAACFAELGRSVVLYDVDAAKIETLRAGALPIHEPGLLELVARGVAAGRLRFTTDPREAVAGCAAVFIAVGTPTTDDGHADLAFVHEAAQTIARHLDGPTVIVNKSTVPVETADLVAAIVRARRVARHDAVVVSNPEFLREGSAVADFMQPDRIVLGCDDRHAEALLRELYAPLNAPTIVTDVHTAEMIKYTANAFLAMKISFANEIAAICERVGADVKTVVAAAGADKRIGTAFFGAGLGFGGSCLPKDVDALRRIAEDAAVEPTLLDAVVAVNARQIDRICARIAYLLGGLARRRIGVLGLAFKAQTDDVRESPALALVERLLAAGAEVTRPRSGRRAECTRTARRARPLRAGRRSSRRRGGRGRARAGDRMERLSRSRRAAAPRDDAPADRRRHAQLLRPAAFRARRLPLRRRRLRRSPRGARRAGGGGERRTVRVVVTGGAGFVGSHLVDRCLADGHEVIAVDDLCTGSVDNLPVDARRRAFPVRARGRQPRIFRSRDGSISSSTSPRRRARWTTRASRSRRSR